MSFNGKFKALNEALEILPGMVRARDDCVILNIYQYLSLSSSSHWRSCAHISAFAYPQASLIYGDWLHFIALLLANRLRHSS